MVYSSFIARRYLRVRHDPGKKGFVSFLTAIAIAGIMLGVAALIIALTILGGFEQQIHEKVVGFITHVQVSGFQNETFPGYQEAADRMKREIPGISAVAPVVSREGMVQFRKNLEGILVKGVDPARDITAMRKYVVEGRYGLDDVPGELPGCVVGTRLLRALRAGVGDTLLVFGLVGTYSDFRSPRILAFVVRGAYESGMAEYDDVYFYLNITAAQRLFALGNRVTGFDLLLHDVSDAPRVAHEIIDTMGYPYYARTFYQLYRNLFTWIELQKKPTPIILGLIIIVATVNIIGTLLMVVMEKRHQIGILKSMGASARNIRRIFLLEGLFIGAIGTILGNLFAFLLCWVEWKFRVLSLPSPIYFMTSVPILFRWENFAVVSLVAMILCLGAAYIPAALAARLDPVESIRFR